MFRVLWACLVLVISSCVLQAQAPQPATPRAGTIQLDVVVSHGKQGRPIPGLKQSDFTLQDNGEARPLESFREVSGADNPTKVVLVVDAVNLDFTRLAYERQQLQAFLKEKDGHLVQPTLLVIVTDTGMQIQPGFTEDGNASSAWLDQQEIGLRELRRSSGFYGAEERLQISLGAMTDLLGRLGQMPGRKMLLWVSPGWPLLSGPEVQLTSGEENRIYDEVIRLSTAVNEAQTTVYSVDPIGAGESPARAFYYESFLKGVRRPGDVLPGNLGLQVLAVQSGGLALSGSNEIRTELDRCLADTEHHYELTYAAPPSDRAHQYHEIRVRVAEPGLSARTRQGYYAQP